MDQGSVGSTVKELRIEDMVRPMIPFYFTMFVTLMLVTYIPEISMWLPSMIAK